MGLKSIQKKLNYYPKDVWLYLMSSEWTKISQEKSFVGRCGHVGDELGSKIIASRLTQSIMRLCFLMEKEYTPYSKWFGTGFSRLSCAKQITPVLNEIFLCTNWKHREEHLSRAYAMIAKKHNSLKITKPLPTKVSNFHGRPYLVIHGDVFANAIKNKIKSNVVKNFKIDIGSINQITNTVDLLENNRLLKKLKCLYK